MSDRWRGQDGHPGPATGISQAAGVPGSGRAEVSQQRRGDGVRLRLTHLPDVHTVIVIRPHLSP